MFATIRYATESNVATITLSRPERKNALSPEMVNELLHALDAARNDREVRVVVLAAEGKVFSAGGDLGQMSGGGAIDQALPLRGDYSDLLRELVAMPRPVIAKVQGHAMGGGLGLVAACSFALVADDAQLGTPELNVGLFPMMIMAVLARTMPRRRLLEMMLFAQKLSAAEAAACGIVNRAVAPAELDAEVAKWAQGLCERSPTALARGLAAYKKMGDMALDEALPMLRDELFSLLATDDAREGLTAFMEKRAPKWTGQ